jgi:hypothetical protein
MVKGDQLCRKVDIQMDYLNYALNKALKNWYATWFYIDNTPPDLPIFSIDPPK